MNAKALEAVDDLAGYDHGILARNGARDFAEALGLDPRAVPVYAIEHHPEEIKGACLDGCTKAGEKRMGIGADEFAEWACRKLGVSYRGAFGRGSLLRNCCESLRKHFEE